MGFLVWLGAEPDAFGCGHGSSVLGPLLLVKGKAWCVFGSVRWAWSVWLERLRSGFCFVVLLLGNSSHHSRENFMIYEMSVEEAWVKIYGTCCVAAAALGNTDLTPSAQKGLSDLLEDVVVVLEDLKATLDASVLTLTLKKAA
jgi:hypothetical protein